MIFFLISSVLKLIGVIYKKFPEIFLQLDFSMHISPKSSGSGTSSTLQMCVMELAVSTKMRVRREDDFAEELLVGR